MKKRLVILFSLLILSIWVMYHLKQYADNAQENKNAPKHLLNDAIKKKLYSGDIILRYGYGFVSDRIVNHLDEKYAISHCGIIKKAGQKWQIIHSDSSQDKAKDGVQIVDFDIFTNNSHHKSIVIVRIKNMDSISLNKIVAVAEKYAQQSVPFDYTFNIHDDHQLFCTELVYQSILQATGRNLFLDSLQKTNLLQFQNFFNPDNFMIVYNEQESP